VIARPAGPGAKHAARFFTDQCGGGGLAAVNAEKKSHMNTNKARGGQRQKTKGKRQKAKVNLDGFAIVADLMACAKVKERFVPYSTFAFCLLPFAFDC
jgi:hypothetical protein